MKNILITLLLLVSCGMSAQTSDSLIVNEMRKEGVEFTHDNSLTLLMSGKAKFDDMFTAIRNAKESVHLEYFNFRNDSIAAKLFEILVQKSKEGVEVRALFDAFGNASNNQPLKKKHLKELRAKGINIVKFDPLHFPWINHVFHRDHRKIVVIDGRIAYTGGMNVADYYITGTELVGSWRDMHCRVDGSVVNELQDIFVRIWEKETKEKLTDPKYFQGGKADISYFTNLKPDTCATAGKKMLGVINREPRKTNKIIRQFYVRAIDSAQDSLMIVNPYLVPTRSIKRAIKRALKRGVKVEIMVSAKNDIPLTPDAMFYQMHKFMKRGADVYIYEGGFHHTKIMMVDGKFCTLGSSNLNSRSLRFDYEENLVIVDPCTTFQLMDMFENDKKSSFKLTPESWDEFRSCGQKFKGWFANLLTPFI